MIYSLPMRIRVALTCLSFLAAGCAGSQESAGEFIDDAALTARVKAAFIADRVVSALDISVESQKGVVHLGGMARSPEEVHQAEKVAGSTAGVRRVRNDIVVR